ncbi:MAG: hypothetical protein RR138_07445, partial [Akkermansia sp.]
MSKLSILLLFCTFSVAHATPTTETFGYFDCIFLNKGDVVAGTNNHPSDMDWNANMVACAGRALNTWMDTLGIQKPKRNIRVVFRGKSDTDVGGSSSIWTTSKQLEDGNGNKFNLQSSSAEALWKDGYDDLNDHTYDIIVNLTTKSEVPFYYGTPEDYNSLGTGQFDAQSIIFHEIGHSLGFHSNCSGWSGDVPVFTTWDLMMKNSNGPISVTNRDHHVGAQYVYTVGSENVSVVNYIAGGSGMSHIDNNKNFVMQLAVEEGDCRRELTTKEIQLMREMGWKIGSNVPEPSSCFLALIGATFLLLHR